MSHRIATVRPQLKLPKRARDELTSTLSPRPKGQTASASAKDFLAPPKKQVRIFTELDHRAAYKRTKTTKGRDGPPLASNYLSPRPDLPPRADPLSDQTRYARRDPPSGADLQRALLLSGSSRPLSQKPAARMASHGPRENKFFSDHKNLPNKSFCDDSLSILPESPMRPSIGNLSYRDTSADRVNESGLRSSGKGGKRASRIPEFPRRAKFPPAGPVLFDDEELGCVKDEINLEESVADIATASSTRVMKGVSDGIFNQTGGGSWGHQIADINDTPLRVATKLSPKSTFAPRPRETSEA